MSKPVLRMCVACRQMKTKNELLRIVFKNEDCSDFVIGQKVDGRGTYLCKDTNCINKCVKTKVFNKIFKKNISQDIYNELLKVELNGK